MLQSIRLSLRFAVDGRRADGSTRYADARPYADIFTSAIPDLAIDVVSVYVARGDLDVIPVTHTTSDGQTAGAVEFRELDGDPTSPWPDSTARLLYDHLAFVQDVAADRRDATLAVKVTDSAFGAVQLGTQRALEERGITPPAPPPA